AFHQLQDPGACWETSDVIEITVHPGQDVNLPCQAPDSFIRALEWTRPDLEPDTVLLYSDGHFETDDQNPSFKDRVELVDRELKNGDVSLILKNVSSIDNGTYKCGVKAGGPRRKKRDSDPIRTIRTVRLQVTDFVEKYDNNNKLFKCSQQNKVQTI
uniref:Ig-like domain-containing protein n=1 Tax=Sander lucioperca TaxID=283035 RepID=A0A8C9ZAK0_SANLU